MRKAWLSSSSSRARRASFSLGTCMVRSTTGSTTRDGKPAVEFTWDGNDEMDPAQGRGWAVLEGEELRGEIFFHLGDESSFVRKAGGRQAQAETEVTTDVGLE